MNPIALVLGAFVLSIAWFRMDLLINAKSFLIILSISTILFLIGVALYFLYGYSYLIGALLCPLLTVALFHFLRKVFLRLVGREPRDTLLDWTPGIAADRFFNVLYFMLGTLILIFVPILVRRLTSLGF